MADREGITRDTARAVGDRLGIDWDAVDAAEFRRGLEVESEQAAATAAAPADDPLLTAGRAAWARLREVPDFYTRLDELAAAAEKHRARRFRI